MPVGLLLIGKETVPILAKVVGKATLDRIFPIIDRARTAAVHRTAKTLEIEFPSGNFVEMNFRFDSPQAKAELEKLVTGQGLPDATVLEKRMVEELRENWPEFASKAELIVGTFLKYFEEECLSRPELRGLTLASLVREESTTTHRIMQEGFRTLEEKILHGIDQMRAETRVLSTSELPYKKVATILEREYVEERDEILTEVRSWRGEGLHTRIEKLAKKTESVLEHVDKEISGSIFRLASTSFLRSMNYPAAELRGIKG
jgi:hypothetical protein